jgi:dUTP pyrophosphatase
MATILNTPEQAKELVHQMEHNTKERAEEKKSVLLKSIEELSKINPDFGGFDGIALLLALPDDQFNLLAPTFLHELEKSINNSNDQLAMAQAMNVSGYRLEDVQKTFERICTEVDEQLGDTLTAQKRDFLKRLVGIIYNAVSEAEGITKRHILIPIEYCREDAKMPTYAHLTDAGMDIYLTEDVTIHPGETVLIPTGIKVALPLGYELQVRPKSGRSLKSKLRIANTPGTIDAGYRDEIGIIADNIDPVIRHADIDENGRLYNILWGSDITLSKGEKIAQLVLSEVPKAVFYEVEAVSAIENDGRKGGFGSTGDK